MNAVLVTGADGFIGSHLVEHLVRQGRKVRAFVQYNSFNSWGWLDNCAPEVKDKFEVFSGDIRDPHGVRAAMQGCDAVLHLAALIAIPYSYHSPDTYVDTNVKGTLNILQAARELRVRRVIHTSTSEVYGTARFVPITEEHPLLGQSPYSASKIAADQMAYSFFASFDLPVVIARPFNTYGPRQSARAVIPTIIAQIANGNRRIRLVHLITQLETPQHGMLRFSFAGGLLLILGLACASRSQTVRREGLELDHIDPRFCGNLDEPFGHGDVAIMVDSSFGNNQSIRLIHHAFRKVVPSLKFCATTAPASTMQRPAIRTP